MLRITPSPVIRLLYYSVSPVLPMQAFIFDFDGVIVDSELHWDNDAIQLYQSLLPNFTRKDDAKLKGRNVRDIYRSLVQDYGAAFSWEEYMESMNVYARTMYAEKAQLIPGILALIDRLQERSIPLALASSSEREWIEIAIKRLDLTYIFTHIVTATDVGIGKPDPAVYLEAARLLKQEPTACIALEDSTHGITAAKSARMKCIGLSHPWGYVQDLTAADTIVEKIDDITMDLLTRL